MPGGIPDTAAAPLAIAVPILAACLTLVAARRAPRPLIDLVATGAAAVTAWLTGALVLTGRGGRGAACWLFLLAALALAGLPPFGPGLGKALSEDAAGAAGLSWLTVVFVLVSAITGGAVLRAGLRIFLGLGRWLGPVERETQTAGEERPETEAALTRTPPTMLAAIALLVAGGAAAGVAVGLVPGFAAAAGRAGQIFADRAGCLGQVLYGAPPRPPPPVAAHWTGSGVLYGVASTLLAGAVAPAALWLPSGVHERARRLRPIVDLLHRLHSGHLGDYVAWLLAGAAALAGLLSAVPG
ncbi:hypothetical protein [Microtetraspora fusca]|uniref:hypothetical protein n=1 Tax=Microtetraspora fusca TaxID=1997 RepID=UPI00082B753C|nr:hypothetical protein [Microtetraspora fusca]